MSPLQKLGNMAFGWQYVFYDGKLFKGPLRVKWFPNGEAYIIKENMIRIPNKLPVEGIRLDEEYHNAKITPLTSGITWHGEE